MIRGLVIGALLAGCIMRNAETTPRLTGTCDGACAHYIACKPGHTIGDRDRCVRECPTVFDDPDALMAYESMTCEDAVEYVDGTGAVSQASN